MKKLLLLPAVALMMASCGGVDVCSCKKTTEEMMEKMKDVDMSDEKAVAALEEEYKADLDACKALGDEMMEGLEGEEKAAKQKEMQEEYEACK